MANNRDCLDRYLRNLTNYENGLKIKLLLKCQCDFGKTDFRLEIMLMQKYRNIKG